MNRQDITEETSELEPLRWLHLSDLHVGAPGKDEWWNTANVFLRELTKRVKKHGEPDVILITGDIAYSASQKEYEDFYSFIETIDERLGKELPIICVPGNHDVDRPDLDKPENFGFDLLRRYNEDDKNVILLRKAFWEQDHPNFNLLSPLFKPYTHFLKEKILPRLEDIKGVSVKISPFPGDIKVNLSFSGKTPLTIVGLNSAWTQCTKDNFFGKIAISPGQLRLLLQPNIQKELDHLEKSTALLLMHHPQTWLHPNALKVFERDIYLPERFAACLHGHMHESEATIVDKMGTRRFFQTQSLFGLDSWGTKNERRKIGYAWGQLEIDGGIKVWPYRLHRDGQNFVLDLDSLQNEEDKYVEIRQGKKTAESKSGKFVAQIEDIQEFPKELMVDYAPDLNPYKFLKFYDIDDGNILYGRGKLIKIIIEKVEQLFRGNNNPWFIGLIGRSGCGKSSLLRAGVLNKLSEMSYHVIAFRPTDFHDDEGNPQNIIQRIVGSISAHSDIELSTDIIDKIERTTAPRRANKAVTEIATALANDGNGKVPRLVIGLDQFEEILDDLHEDEYKENWKDLVQFIKCALKTKLIGFIYTLETSRKDIPQFTDLKYLFSDETQQFEVKGFSEKFYREIITRPFSNAGYQLNDKEIVSEIMKNAISIKDEMSESETDSLLPLMALTLSRLFEIVMEKAPKKARIIQKNLKEGLKQAQDTIGLKEIGDKKVLDIRNAIETEAKNAWTGKDEDIGHFLRPLLRVSDSSLGSFVLKKVPIHPYADEKKQADQFIRHRLMVEEGKGKIRLVHEAVVRFWPSAQEWFNQEKDLLNTERIFQKKADHWFKKGQKPILGIKPEDIEDAADILDAYFRVWPFLGSRISRVDHHLRDYCLAIFNKSNDGTKKIRRSITTGTCYVHRAVSYGQINLLKRFKIKSPESLHSPHPRPDKRTPIFTAVWASSESVSYLLDNGASATKKDEKGWRPLVGAIIMGNKQIFDDLIGHYKKYQLEDWPGCQTALHIFGASNLSRENSANHLAMAQYLVEKRKLDPNKCVDGGRTPLHLIAGEGHTEIFDYFAQISNVNATTEDGWTALHLASRNGHIDIMTRLLEHEEFIQDGREALTAKGVHALHLAVSNKKPCAVELLLDYCIDPNVRAISNRNYGRTALHMAANLLRSDFSGNPQYWEDKEHAREIVRILLACPEVDVNCRDAEKRTPLSFAKEDSKALKMILADKRLDPNNPIEPNGPAPLLLCAEIADWDLTEKLLGRSSDAVYYTKTDKGNTLLHLLISNKAPMTLIKHALELAPTLSMPNKEGYTPLMLAVIEDDLDLIRLILASGKGAKSLSDRQGSVILVAIRHSASSEILDELLDNTVAPFLSTDIRGWTPHHAACARASESNIDWVIKHNGPSLNEIKDEWRRRPIDLAPPTLQQKWGLVSKNMVVPKSWDSDLHWQVLDKSIRRELINRLSPVDDKYELTNRTRAECSNLTFYNQDSIKIVRFTPKEYRKSKLRLYFITHITDEKFEVYRLNGVSSPIHKLNSKGGLKIKNSNVLDYLRFFCSFVRGEKGPFLIAEDVKQNDMPVGLSKENISSMKAFLRPAQYFGQSNKKFWTSAIVYYANELCFADFTIENSGKIEMKHELVMLDDLPIS